MLSSEDKILIERYLQKNLNEKALVDFLKRMDTDDIFFQEVLAEQIIQEGALGVHFKEIVEKSKNDASKDVAAFKKSLEAIELEVYLEEEILQSAQNDEEEETTYSLEELLADFQVVPSYEKMILTEMRSEQIKVIKPLNRFHCKNHQLTFVLKLASTVGTAIRIENNQMKALLKQKIGVGLTNFTIDLPPNLFPSGLYYWKLWNGDGMVMGSFLIPQSPHTPPKT